MELTEKQKQSILGKIEVEGFHAWLEEFALDDGIENPEYRRLVEQANKANDAIHNYLGLGDENI